MVCRLSHHPFRGLLTDFQNWDGRRNGGWHVATGWINPNTVGVFVMAIAVASPIVSDREWNAHILAQLAGGKLTQEQALAQLKTAPKSNGGPLSCKQSEKGGVSVYGLQRMPVTLYAEQWERLLGFAEEIKGFIKSHPDLSRKQRS
jgi:hypothetical protein